MNFPEWLDISNVLESFPVIDTPEIKPHRIVKKQMADYPSPGKNKRSIASDDPRTRIIAIGTKRKENKKLLKTLKERGRSKEDKIKIKIKETPDPSCRSRFKDKNTFTDREIMNQYLLVKRKPSKEKSDSKPVPTTAAAHAAAHPTAHTASHPQAHTQSHTSVHSAAHNPAHPATHGTSHLQRNLTFRAEILKNLVGRPCKKYVRYADKGDVHSYFECEVELDGGMKFKHKRCPEGELFSPKYLECLRMAYLKAIHRPKRVAGPVVFPKKIELPETMPEPDIEPSNEWLDATQGNSLKIPSEFKPKQKPKLKIYHLKWDNRMEPLKPAKLEKRSYGYAGYEARRKSLLAAKGGAKKQSFRHHSPRSFLVRVNKKEGRENQERGNRRKEKCREEEEYDDEDYEEEDDEDEEENEEFEEADDDAKDEWNGCKPDDDFLDVDSAHASTIVATAKRFPPEEEKNELDLFPFRTKSQTVKNKHSDASKKVLIDANIKVDGAIGNALRNMLSRKKEKSSRRKKSRDEMRRWAKAVSDSDLDFRYQTNRRITPNKHFPTDRA